MADTKLVKADQNTAMAVPSFVEQNVAKEGMEHITQADVQMPRLAIAQQMSPELVDGDPKFIGGLKIGDFFNSLTQEIYGTRPMDFCVVRCDPPRYIEFTADGKGVLDMNVPPNDPRTLFGPNGEKPLATKFYDFIIMLLPTRELISLSFKSTGLKVAKQLNGLIQYAGNVKLFAPKFTISTTMVQGTKGRYATYVVRRSHFLPDEETYKFAEEVYNGLRHKVITIDHDAHETDAGEGDTSFDPASLERGGM